MLAITLKKSDRKQEIVKLHLPDGQEITVVLIRTNSSTQATIGIEAGRDIIVTRETTVHSHTPVKITKDRTEYAEGSTRSVRFN